MLRFLNTKKPALDWMRVFLILFVTH